MWKGHVVLSSWLDVWYCSTEAVSEIRSVLKESLSMARFSVRDL